MVVECAEQVVVRGGGSRQFYLEETLSLDLFNNGDLDAVINGGCIETNFGFGMKEKD